MIQQNLRAAMVCVDYSDLMAITLPYNRHHFSEVLIVTTPDDTNTIQLAESHDCQMYLTREFYEGGASFNKWLALESGLDHFGRHGWMCLMDADVLWPKEIKHQEYEIGKLYTPLRHMFSDITDPFPQEHEWKRYRTHGNTGEWAGYTQIFHADDYHLGPSPWHQTNWKHAGGADSFFQRKWEPQNKVRTPWNVLHVGEAGKNWCGRATELMDGSRPEESHQRSQTLSQFVAQRKKAMSRKEHDPYHYEKM